MSRRIFLFHLSVKVFYLLIKFMLQSFYDLNRLCYPLWQLLLHFVVAVPRVDEKYHSVIKCMTNHSSKCLVNRSHCPHEVPFLASYDLLFVNGPACNILKMSLLFNYERVFYVGIRNSNKKDCPTHAVRKINAFAYFTTANYGENSAFA